jgi:thiaminase
VHRVRSVHYGRRDEGWVERSPVRQLEIYAREGDAASLLMALAACLLGYGEVGLWLQREAKRPQSWAKLEDNPYKAWIEDYAGEKYQAAVKVGIGACGNYAERRTWHDCYSII